ncbi:hypothetical protein WJX72_009921 [[Myrmecia] bisecta]|uniref:Uncharacterized protein n=1 Tax=[Myrmecia] bisecta TaxID=41462 RepID=A0AAW1P5Z8_9CHLO
MQRLQRVIECLNAFGGSTGYMKRFENVLVTIFSQVPLDDAADWPIQSKTLRQPVWQFVSTADVAAAAVTARPELTIAFLRQQVEGASAADLGAMGSLQLGEPNGSSDQAAAADERVLIYVPAQQTDRTVGAIPFNMPALGAPALHALDLTIRFPAVLAVR